MIKIHNELRPEEPRIVRCALLSVVLFLGGSELVAPQVVVKSTNQVVIQMDLPFTQVGSWIDFSLEPKGLFGTAQYDKASGQWIARGLAQSFVPEEQTLTPKKFANTAFSFRDYDFKSTQGELRNSAGYFRIESQRARWSLEVRGTPKPSYKYRRKTPKNQQPATWKPSPNNQSPSIMTMSRDDSIDLIIYEKPNQGRCLFSIHNIGRENLSGEDFELLGKPGGNAWIRYKSNHLAEKIFNERWLPASFRGCPALDPEDPYYANITQLVKLSGSGPEAEALARQRLSALIAKGMGLTQLDLCTPDCTVAIP